MHSPSYYLHCCLADNRHASVDKVRELISNSDRYSVFYPVKNLLNKFLSAAVSTGCSITQEASTAAIEAIIQLLDLRDKNPTSDDIDSAFMHMAGMSFGYKTQLEAQLAAATSTQPS